MVGGWRGEGVRGGERGRKRGGWSWGEGMRWEWGRMKDGRSSGGTWTKRSLISFSWWR